MNDKFDPVPRLANLGRSLPRNPGIDTSYAQTGECSPYLPGQAPLSPVEVAVECLNANQQQIHQLLGDLANRLRMVIDHNEKDQVNVGAKECQTASCPLEARIIDIQIGQCQAIERLIDLMGRLAL